MEVPDDMIEIVASKVERCVIRKMALNQWIEPLATIIWETAMSMAILEERVPDEAPLSDMDEST